MMYNVFDISTATIEATEQKLLAIATHIGKPFKSLAYVWPHSPAIGQSDIMNWVTIAGEAQRKSPRARYSSTHSCPSSPRPQQRLSPIRPQR
mmetsp:Transcript_16071/g.45739  ORF Transcript_16071/g.45739 Transcript_16071/m.45739 type:complete len:92 (+) Transcript_16071:110-385(+)